ncbi:30S ribosome-binding factor RbfA [Corynebacterium poyangense]|uniref:Ribosome-binding factor A n=1 Tax=Corynebacterium poyangense TaxID=2684405 RepID=A0A7H0SPG4_9CORY|nr:30S ribosome-binding factor RbfA [Corynebacterium poyangense]MBZ8178019.1 30S ribosome-binding factor RbfA [Corynebacterium poyangense]QNQ90439.1 30S ribosome-binding factor RbfA [Corynebacterium poyangense]
MSDHQRAARMAKRIQTIVATAIERQIKDPRLELVTITDTKVTGDLHDATVYYTVRGRTLAEEPDFDAAAEVFTKVRGQLRKIVGNELNVRFTPTLSFEVDTVPETSARMEELLARAKARDAELAKLKETAVPAGDANPYRDSEQEED